MTQKPKDCGVFGVSSDEFLNHARSNREQWETEGEQVAAEIAEAVRAKHGAKGLCYVAQHTFFETNVKTASKAEKHMS